MSVPHCTRTGCASPLAEVHDKTLGRISWACLPCERNKRGLCRDCPAHLGTPRALRCETCRLVHLRWRWATQAKRWRRHNATVYNASERRRHHRLMQDPVKAPIIRDRKRRNARLRKPRTDADRKRRRERDRERRQDPRYVKKLRARRRKYLRTHEEQRREAVERVQQYRDENRELLNWKRRMHRRALRAAAQLAAPFVEAQFTGFVNRDAEIILDRALAADSQRETA